ncbi:MAG: hypothetical protein QXD57_07130 [Ignisphaera sp.]
MLSIEVDVVERLSVDVANFVNSIKSRLPRPRNLSWFQPTFDYREAIEQVNVSIPVAPDIVDWMREATATEAIFDVFAQSVSSNKGAVASLTGDGYVPGVRVEDVYFQSYSGDVVERSGAVLVTPVGNINIPLNSKVLVAKGSFLAWACARNRYIAQWIGTILKYKLNPEAKLGSDVKDIPFPSSGTFVAPVVIDVTPPLSIRHVDYIQIYSDRDQTVNLIFTQRNSYDSQIANIVVNVSYGVSIIKLRVFGISSYSVIIQPSDGVSSYLQSYSVRRI